MSMNDRMHNLLTEKSEGYVFACPGVALSSERVLRHWEPGVGWTLSYQDAGRLWSGKGESVPLAYLDLIRARLGEDE